MKILPSLFLAGCLRVQSDVDLTQCPSELEELKSACAGAEVIGRHKNMELYKAVDDLQKCVGEKVRILCQDPGLGEVKTLSITKTE